MRYVAAYLLAVLGGKEAPSAADIEKILSSVGIEADSTRLSKVVEDLKGKSVDELIKEGREKLSSMPVGGGGAAPAAAAVPDAAAPAAAAKEEKKRKHFLLLKKKKIRRKISFDFARYSNDEQNITIFRMNLL